jgi:hypothetical protein
MCPSVLALGPSCVASDYHMAWCQHASSGKECVCVGGFGNICFHFTQTCLDDNAFPPTCKLAGHASHHRAQFKTIYVSPCAKVAMKNGISVTQECLRKSWGPTCCPKYHVCSAKAISRWSWRGISKMSRELHPVVAIAHLVFENLQLQSRPTQLLH